MTLDSTGSRNAAQFFLPQHVGQLVSNKDQAWERRPWQVFMMAWEDMPLSFGEGQMTFYVQSCRSTDKPFFDVSQYKWLQPVSTSKSISAAAAELSHCFVLFASIPPMTFAAESHELWIGWIESTHSDPQARHQEHSLAIEQSMIDEDVPLAADVFGQSWQPTVQPGPAQS